jgi:4-amino-4-deoxy-L-arabinose transferase-like glycosyltransferase
MKRSWFTLGFLVYALLCIVVFPLVLKVPMHLIFDGDAAGYNLGAVHLLQSGFYSMDGVTPFFDREPGMSFFLLPIYTIFGAENGLAIVASQIVVYFLAAWAFCHQLARSHGQRVAGICFLLLLTSGSVFHSIFSAYRECLALVLLLLFSALILANDFKSAWWKTMLAGLLFGALILTYYPFVFFPPVLLFVWWLKKKPLSEAVSIIALCYALVGVWVVRNYSYDGKIRIVDNRRTAIMWYVRGEQAEKVYGLEPFKCLWSEYVSRDWSGRSPACSFNALMNTRWSNGFDLTADYSDVAAEGRAKVLQYFPSYLWFSAVDVIELHIPYVGGGWSSRFNLFAAVTAFILYAGFIVGLPNLLKREEALWTALIVYNTAIFALTDATPRYLVPVLFCYAVIAALGYHRTLPRPPRYRS